MAGISARFVVSTLLAVAGFSTLAQAADLPAQMPARAPAVVAPAAFSWNGVYIGGYGGYGWGRLKSTPFLGQDIDFNGAMVGGTIGFNYQPVGSAFVFGIEADGGWANIKANETIAVTAAGVALGTINWTSEIQATASVRGRIGAAFDRLLVYGTGGGGWIRNEMTGSATAAAGAVIVGAASASDTQNHFGWVAGAGAEWAFSPNWSVKAEYLYWSMGSENYFNNLVAGGVASGDITFHTVKGGINFRF